MDIASARKISNLESQFVPPAPWVKGANTTTRVRVDVGPDALRLYFDEKTLLTKQERGILSLLEQRLSAVDNELSQTSPEARNRLRHSSVHVAREAVAAGKPVPNFAEEERRLEERFTTARLTRALLGADLAAVMGPIYRRLGEQLLKKRALIEADLISRARAIGLTLETDCDPLLAVGATAGMLFQRAGNTRGLSWQLPSITFRELGLSIDLTKTPN